MASTALSPIRAPALDAVELRVEQLIKSMTLEEKIAQLNVRHEQGVATGPEAAKHDRDVDEEVRKGLGSFLNVLSPEAVARLQRVAMTESKHKIPLLIGEDAIAGYRTIGPQPIALASSFDPEVARRSGLIAGKEGRAYLGPFITYAPNVDFHKDPRNGRMVESWGSSPHLISKMASANVTGFHDAGVAVTAKHFAGYGMPDGGADYGAVHVSSARFHEDVIAPFRAVLEAGADSVMYAFNSLNGVPCHGNKELDRILRKQLRSEVPTVADWGGLRETIDHGVASDLKEAALRGLRGGVGSDMVSEAYSQYAADLVREGLVSEQVIDDHVRRLLRLKLKLGLFDNPFPEPGAIERSVMTAENKDIMRSLAERTFVLLKNGAVNGRPVLPLAGSESAKTIAVIGPIADNGEALLGHWSVRGEGQEAITALQGIRARASGEQKVLYAQGSKVFAGSPELLQEALSVAKESDVIIAVVGETAHMSGEAGTRLKPNLPRAQQELLEALHATGKPVVAVLINGRPLTGLSWANEHLTAILEAWQPGTMGGEAIANTLFGSDKAGRPVNPGGKMCQEVARHEGELGYVHHMRLTMGRPAFRPDTEEAFASDRRVYDDDGNVRGEDPSNLVSGRFTDDPSHPRHQPLWSFGEGKSYTTFEMEGVSAPERVSLATLKREGLTVRATVTNTGERPGDEVLQVYLKKSLADTVQPEKRLVGFQRVTLAPGERRELEVHLSPSAFQYYSEIRKRFVLDPGSFEVWVGSSSRDKDLKSIRVSVEPGHQRGV
jgi:beta-glucosidase